MRSSSTSSMCIPTFLELASTMMLHCWCAEACLRSSEPAGWRSMTTCGATGHGITGSVPETDSTFQRGPESQDRRRSNHETDYPRAADDGSNECNRNRQISASIGFDDGQLVEGFQSSLGSLRTDAIACEVSNNTRVQLIISGRWRCACD